MAKTKTASQGPMTRFAFVRAFMMDRGVHNYMSVFAAHKPELKDYADDIALWWNGRKKLTDTDLPIIEKLEAVVESIKNV